MPTKTINDLPADALIEVRHLHENVVTVEAVHSDNSLYYSPGEEAMLLGVRLRIVRSPETSLEFLQVEDAQMEHGFEALAYDLACESAGPRRSVRGCGARKPQVSILLTKVPNTLGPASCQREAEVHGRMR